MPFPAMSSPDSVEHPTPLLEVLDIVRDEIGQYIHFRTLAQLETVVLFIAASYLAPHLEVATYLNLTSPVPGCGKSTLAVLIEKLGFQAWFVSVASPAFIYRMLDARPDSMMVIDEVDAVFKHADKSESASLVASIINAGNSRDTAKIGRVERQGSKHEPKLLSCFGFKVMSGVGRTLPPATASRALTIDLERAVAGELKVEWEPTPAQRKSVESVAVMIAHTMSAGEWSWDNGTLQPDLPMTNRERQIWRPLAAVAQAAGGDWSIRLKAAMDEYSTSSTSDAPRLLSDLGDCLRDTINGHPSDLRSQAFESTDAGLILPTMSIVAALTDLEGSTWTAGKYPALTTSRLGRILDGWAIRSMQRWDPEKQVGVRGYRLVDLATLIGRYTPHTPNQAVRPLGTQLPLDENDR